ncbi:NADH dehydrogenase [ubiquinone] 1 beta subcomplex subunit 10-like [Panonychus citri]|uniref:NADH dehydrogenase [ubiquinone] 1 beta subcomplex subunit 10-like n=1 Tax=Panonychus citri TaxID=50023 RepID=UPI0023080B75|nr:NADH dehydrogenase [ubiquinone] 1 beta subcomplex subunit 10-like [Panonychus citri]
MEEKFDNMKEHSFKKEEYHIGPFGRVRSDYLSSPVQSLSNFAFNLFDVPATWIHDKIVVPNRKQSVYYHYKFPRVPTVDECYVDDYACLWEADQQYKRDRKVEKNIIKILVRRYDECMATYGGVDSTARAWCEHLLEDRDKAETNYMIKYGELRMDGTAALNLMENRTRSADVYLKQKHRYVWERKQQLKKEKEENESKESKESI